MNKFIQFISKFNRFLGQISQTVLYFVVVIALLDVIASKDHNKWFIFIGVIMLVILFVLNIILIVITMILIFSRKINDDDSYDRDKETTDLWSALFMASSIIIPFLAWFTFIRNDTIGNNSLCILIWFLQWSLLFNSYFYNAFLKQYT